MTVHIPDMAIGIRERRDNNLLFDILFSTLLLFLAEVRVIFCKYTVYLFCFAFFCILMFSLIFMKLKSHDCIPDCLCKSSLSEHSLKNYFQNPMSNNNPCTCVFVGIVPKFLHALSRILLIFIHMQMRRFSYRSMTL